MSDDAVHRLIDAQGTLLAALDAHDVAAIERAGRDVADAVAQLRDATVARTADLPDALGQAIATADIVRARLNLLTDRNRRRLDRLVDLAGAPRAQRYGRHGRLS